MMLTEIQMQELWDKQALHENMFTYCRGIDRMDLDLMKSTYWPDGTDDHGRFVGPNHEWCEVGIKSREALVSCNHHCSNVLIELNGDQAKRETMFIVVTTYKDHGRAMFLGGRYRDLCEKRDGEWKVLHRTCVWDWNRQSDSATGWGLMQAPQLSNWGLFYPNDPIYQSDWGVRRPTRAADSGRTDV
jgi:hypothetical protein